MQFVCIHVKLRCVLTLSPFTKPGRLTIITLPKQLIHGGYSFVWSSYKTVKVFNISKGSTWHRTYRFRLAFLSPYEILPSCQIIPRNEANNSPKPAGHVQTE